MVKYKTGKYKIRCKFCEAKDYPVVAKLPGKIIEGYCSQCGEMVFKYKLKKKPGGGYFRKNIPF